MHMTAAVYMPAYNKYHHHITNPPPTPFLIIPCVSIKIIWKAYIQTCVCFLCHQTATVCLYKCLFSGMMRLLATRVFFNIKGGGISGVSQCLKLFMTNRMALFFLYWRFFVGVSRWKYQLLARKPLLYTFATLFIKKEWGY